MEKAFQRIGAQSNTHVGREFELAAKEIFASIDLPLQQNVKIPIGIEFQTKPHAFDLVNLEQRVIIECKSHKWTTGGNVPSAKMTTWNEAMYYFVAAPRSYRKMMFVLRDYSDKHGKTLAEYYLDRYAHLIPTDVEFWEFDETTQALYFYNFDKQEFELHTGTLEQRLERYAE